MVYWIAKLSTHLGPSYLAIADEIEKAIRDGALKSGSRLPSQRLLADFLGLHVNTVNRAMRETARRGLTAGATRRGTVVLARSP
ncbi:winged helix-turn-helix domain-containing protein [Paraburkholderia sp. A2WS-5]